MPPTYRIARGLFLRILGGCLAFGFLALLHQAPGLIGERGITPLAEILAGLERALGDAVFWRAPTLFWLAQADWFVRAVAGLGFAAGLLLALGVAPRACCIVAYVCWLSYRSLEPAEVRWFNYPFDDLQSEVVFLAIFVAPATLWPWQRPRPLPRWVHWLVLWLLFRLLFGPGIAKVLYHAPWRDLTAVGDFLLTMPHPTAAAAWFADLPPDCIRAMSLLTLVCELGCPFLLFVPGRTRRLAAGACIALMLAIQLVCNIRGFQLLTIALLLLLFDDRSLARLVWWRRAAPAEAPEIAPGSQPRDPRLGHAGAAAVVTLIVAASIGPFLNQFRIAARDVSPALGAVAGALEPFRLAAGYTMFCILPQQRSVLVVQASDDGAIWHDYELLGPPAAIDCAPTLFAPYHDYLGFKLWFAGFCPPAQDAWLVALQARLLAGAPEVERLFCRRPLAGAPPPWVRVAWFRYRYASPELRATGVHWQREWLGERLPPQRRRE
ncbi:MAG: lipase maturation factor family protein [Planctomycetes bacterium]|nr:lipase maturation factor family protein [Planctomycetota bacterium]